LLVHRDDAIDLVGGQEALLDQQALQRESPGFDRRRRLGVVVVVMVMVVAHFFSSGSR
jgi:hypothetical protein